MPLEKCANAGAGVVATFVDSTCWGGAAATVARAVGLAEAVGVVPRPAPLATRTVTATRASAATAATGQRPRRRLQSAGAGRAAGDGIGAVYWANGCGGWGRGG